MKKKLILLTATVVFTAYNVMAQPDFSPGAKGIYDKSIKPLFPIIIVIIAAVCIVPNLHMVTKQEDRDYKGFFMAIGRYLLAVSATITLISYLWTLALK